MELSKDIEELVTQRLLMKAGAGMTQSRKQLEESNLQPKNERAVTAPDFVKLEKNLSSLGFFTPSSKKIKNAKAKIITFTRTVEGKRVEAKVTIAPASLFGLPITADQDKYLALQKIIGDIKQEAGEVKNPVGFTSAELLRLQGKRVTAGKNYEDITEWLKRMTLTGIISEGTVYLAGKKIHATDTFHVFERSVSLGHELEEGVVADKNYVWLSEWQLENINNNYLLPVDYETYKQLKNHIAKALVPLLQIWLYATKDEGVFEKRYDEICQHLSIRQYKHFSEIIRNFAPALDELVKHDYLASWQIEKTSDNKDYKVIFHHGEKFYQDRRKRIGQKEQGSPIAAPKQLQEASHFEPEQRSEQPTTAQATLPTLATAENEQFLQRLIVEFGIHAPKAFELLQTKKEAVILQLEAWPYRNANPQNRAGWMIEAIEQNYSAPTDYLQEKQKQKERQELAARQVVIAACNYCNAMNGWRYVERDGHRAARRCTHDPAIEDTFPTQPAL